MKKTIKIIIAIIGIAFLLLLTIFYKKANSQPYSVDIQDSEIPVFTEIDIDFKHEFDNSSLPLMASAIIDLDNDGIPEVFIGGGKDQKDVFFTYKNNRFEYIENSRTDKQSGDASLTATVIDWNRDGFSDLLVGRDSGVYLYLNRDGYLKPLKLQIQLNEKSLPVGLALADLNQDGFIDIYVSTYLRKELMEGQNIFNQEGYGSRNELFLNNGDDTFKNITDESGLAYVHNAFVAVFSDVDEDGDLDIIAVHDTGHVKTWKNNGNLKFKDVSNPTSPPNFGYPMGIAVGDYNNDGLVDFFFSNTGGTAPPFIAKGDLREDQNFHDKLIFFKNQGNFQFKDVAEETLTADYEFSWGTVFEDLNLDGRQDLIISQNYIDFPPHKFFRLPGRLLIQSDDGKFASTEEKSGVTNRNYEITSLVADFNKDGYSDIVKINLNGEARAFLNQANTENHYLQVQLLDSVESVGAKVTLELQDGKKLDDFFVNGEGLASDQTHILTFGLGKSDKPVKSVTVKYINGKTIAKNNIAVDSRISIGK
ncbi:MAG: CRTAC1 family protein [Leptospira sp.]|nr:CRTAC1 family protein [Leptospira sp.]